MIHIIVGDFGWNVFFTDRLNRMFSEVFTQSGGVLSAFLFNLQKPFLFSGNALLTLEKKFWVCCYYYYYCCWYARHSALWQGLPIGFVYSMSITTSRTEIRSRHVLLSCAGPSLHAIGCFIPLTYNNGSGQQFLRDYSFRPSNRAKTNFYSCL